MSLVATGGTIAAVATESGARGHRGADDLAPSDGAAPAGIAVRPRDVLRRSSRAMTLDDLWTLAQAVRSEIAAGCDGVVVTHGTDTLEETAYALGLLVPTTVPVVVTGAMRAAHLAGPDGPANVRAAVVAAADPALAAYGPVVVFSDEVHVARLVTKVHGTRIAAFASPAAGPVGSVVEDRLELLLGPPPTPDLLPSTAPPDRRVAIVPTATDVDGSWAEAAAAGCDGLVVAALGGGHVSPALGEALIRVAESGRPVVVTSRCPDGALLARTYGGAGSEIELRKAGLHFAARLTAPKARLRLVFGLSAGIPAEEMFPAHA
ncbi:asparaginase domain-containing protein [Pseudonocardia zijingensis]|uniref:Asparaginase n=1 Tax=Pseudonocardia zijingensis TaxID=153376 RepID=A0ABP4B5B0_9PSEU